MDGTSGSVEDQPVSVNVIEAIASTKGVPADQLDPLYSVVDPDALDRLLSPTSRDSHRNGRVTFEYEGCIVVVKRDGQLEIEIVEESDVAGEEVG